MSTVRRNPVSTLARTVSSNVKKTTAAVTRSVKGAATKVATSAQKTATTVGKNVSQTASRVGKQVSTTANNVGTAVSNKTKQVANATGQAVKTVRDATKKQTVESQHNRFSSKFDVKDGKVEVGVTRGFGQKMDEAPTLKSKATKNYQEPVGPSTFKDKAKAGMKEVGNSVGINVFDPDKSKFEKDWDATSIKTKRVDSATVDKKGYDTGYRVLSAYADGSGSVKIGKTVNIEGKIDVGAVLAQGTIEGKKKLGSVDLTGKAEATVGATASASGSVRFDLLSPKPTVKVKAGVDAFVGAKVSAEGRIGNDYAGVGAKGELMAGLGAKAKLDAGIENGRFKAKVELGAALGIGGSVSFNVDINYQKAVDKVVGTGKQAVQNIKSAASTVANAASNAASSVASGAKSLASAGWKTVSGWF